MGTKTWFIRTDYYIQLTIIVGISICCISYIGFIFGVLGLIPLGIWQTGSGIYWAITQRDKKRIIYLGIVVFYFLMAYTVIHVQMFDKFFPILAAIPIFLGIMYFYMTWTEYKAFQKIRHQKIENTELLDA